MRYKLSLIAVLVFASVVNAQRAEVAVTLNEAFFNTLVDSFFNNFDPPEFPIARTPNSRQPDSLSASTYAFGSADALVEKRAPCAETIKILRESGGVRTSVRIRDGKIYVPLAFSGTYSPPFVGCVEFAGWADSSIELEFDRDGQRLIGHATVSSVNLNGAGGVGGALIAKMLQRSLDRKMNPLEILNLEKLSFGIPIQNSGNLRLKAIGARPELSAGSLTLHIEYEFLKG